MNYQAPRVAATTHPKALHKKRLKNCIVGKT